MTDIQFTMLKTSIDRLGNNTWEQGENVTDALKDLIEVCSSLVNELRDLKAEIVAMGDMWVQGEVHKS